MELHRELGALLGGTRILQALELGQVGTGAEPLPGARQHDAADALSSISFFQVLQEGLSELRIERVALLRAIHRENPDRIPVLNDQDRDRPYLFVLHSEASLRLASSASATSRRMISAAGRISSTRPALCPASTLPHSTSPSSAACFRDEFL
jgi:hypothetical protein